MLTSGYTYYGVPTYIDQDNPLVKWIVGSENEVASFQSKSDEIYRYSFQQFFEIFGIIIGPCFPPHIASPFHRPHIWADGSWSAYQPTFSHFP